MTARPHLPVPVAIAKIVDDKNLKSTFVETNLDRVNFLPIACLKFIIFCSKKKLWVIEQLYYNLFRLDVKQLRTWHITNIFHCSKKNSNGLKLWSVVTERIAKLAMVKISMFEYHRDDIKLVDFVYLLFRTKSGNKNVLF